MSPVRDDGPRRPQRSPHRASAQRRADGRHGGGGAHRSCTASAYIATSWDGDGDRPRFDAIQVAVVFLLPARQCRVLHGAVGPSPAARPGRECQALQHPRRRVRHPGRSAPGVDGVRTGLRGGGTVHADRRASCSRRPSCDDRRTHCRDPARGRVPARTSSAPGSPTPAPTSPCAVRTPATSCPTPRRTTRWWCWAARWAPTTTPTTVAGPRRSSGSASTPPTAYRCSACAWATSWPPWPSAARSSGTRAGSRSGCSRSAGPRRRTSTR